MTTEDRQEWKRDAAALGILAAVILTGFADLLIGDSTVLSARYFDVHLQLPMLRLVLVLNW